MTDLFLDIRFPSQNCIFLRQSIEFFTNVQIAKNGFETRMILEEAGKNKFLLEETILHNNTITEICNFFKIVKGRGFSFRFKDELDFKAENQNFIINEDGVFLCKKYEYQGYAFIKRITKPVKNTLQILSGDVPLTEGLDYTIDFSTGQIATEQDVNLLKAYFEFDLNVRFDADELLVQKDLDGNLFIKNLVLIEVLN